MILVQKVQKYILKHSVEHDKNFGKINIILLNEKTTKSIDEFYT